jgi:transposase-like protein
LELLAPSHSPLHYKHGGIDTLTGEIRTNGLWWPIKPNFYARHRFSPEIIRHAVWLYLRFTLSYRDVEVLLAERALEVGNESICRWILKFGSAIAKNLRSVRPRPHDHWQLDEMVVSTGGQGIVTLAEHNRF